MRLALVGFGLIGGSIAQALREAGSRDDAGSDWSVAAWSPSGEGPRAAAAAGAIDTASATVDDAIDGAELILLAAPPLACLELIDRLAGPLRAALDDDAVVTDVASTKAAIVGHAADAGLRFVGGHPMAGKETTGWDAASGELFAGRPWVVVPADAGDTAAVERVQALVRACGARPLALSATDHDAAVAAISHLPLVVAAALVEAVTSHGAGTVRADWPLAAELAASGWQGATRLARGDVEMGAGIIATNAPAIATRLRDLRDVLDGWLAELEQPDGPPATELVDRLAAAKRTLEDRP